jgi:Anp1
MGQGSLRFGGAYRGHYFYTPKAKAGGETPSVLVATPMKNAAGASQRYFQLLHRLHFPKDRLSLAILDSDSTDQPSDEDRQKVGALESQGVFSSLGFSTDSHEWRHSGTLYAVLAQLPALQQRFASVQIFQHNFKEPSGGGFAPSQGTPLALDAENFGGDRHHASFQEFRRAGLARSRNHLLISALESANPPPDFVLWLDCDLSDYNADVLKRLIATGKEIVVPNVVVKAKGRSFDLNSWKATQPAYTQPIRNAFGYMVKNGTTIEVPGDDASAYQVRRYHDATIADTLSNVYRYSLYMEGYPEFDFMGHKYLSHYRTPKEELEKSGSPPEPGKDKVIRLDGVGGAMLLVNAELHRHGLIFPPFPYRKRIETEGLAMMALDFGVTSHGLPDVEVIHH